MVRSTSYLFVIAIVMLSGKFAAAQTAIAPAPLRPHLTPTTSPFLFLGNGRFNSALSYYQRILPEREFRQANRTNYGLIQGLEKDVTVLRQREEQLADDQLKPTGHRSHFFNPGNHFNNTGSYYDRSQLRGR
ncbi:hypothetical protein KOR42_37510 [Thalassoglobus neptunius]|uniref:Tetratricopeptide repeat protein n=1 Tax=Thalassoglobus neptunius TaxID=1938619 RepID=A0A5C5WIS8_9PLAN|nr:hypothetical protein [Thalassoglobus neptunius]TWT49933.1 hypothetical protein KOR42_37510 [Thalassoglobus neptunius]